MTASPADPLRPLRGDSAEIVAALRPWLAAEDEPQPLVVETSGSTGAPKRVVLSRRAVVASASATHARLGGPGRWLLALPPTYVAGLQVLVRSLVGGEEPAVLSPDRSVAEVVRAMAATRGRRYASLVPTQLSRLLDSAPDAAALAELDAVLLGGGPIDPALRHRAANAGITVVATYGSSETAGGCVYDGLPLDGVDVELDDDGRIRLRGPVLFDGYDGDPALTFEVLVDGWFRTSDLGRFVDGRLQVLGRVDDVVVSGGLNVPAAAVARRLRAHAGISAVEVIGIDDEVWGQRVVAFLVGDVDLDAVRDWVAADLPREWAPRQVVPLAELPLLANGKVDRLGLREMVIG